MMDVVTLGETMVMFHPETKGALRYVHSFTKTIAGAESNVAIALARLGHSAGWFSKIGDDEFGRYIILSIRGEGVDVSRVTKSKTHSTGLLFKERFAHVNPNVYYYRKDSAASTLSQEDLDPDYIRKAKILHLSGITPALSESSQKTVFKAIEIAKENKIKISFDPNIRLKLWSLQEAKGVLLDIAKQADIIFPGIDEGKMLLGTENPKKIAEHFQKMGCERIAIKLGAKGCYVVHKEEAHFVEGYPVESLEDTVGAGDGFAAGFLAGVLRKLPLKECAQWGNGVGAMAVLVRGDMEGFPTKSQLMEFIGKSDYIDR